MRLRDKVAMVVGGGQSPGETIGNGRATAMLFAREGAKVLVVDRDLASAEETVAMIAAEDGEAAACQADVTDEATLAAAVADCTGRWQRLDILHNNVGISIAGNDAPVTEITVEAFDHCVAVNLRGMVLACKHALPVMRQQQSGSIINISSLAAWSLYPLVAYKTTKSAVIALTEQLAAQNAQYGVRANVILPGLMDTPMAVDTRVAATGKSRQEIKAERDARVPLGGLMGTAWDVAQAALFLASDEAGFITGAALPVDGGSSVQVG
ncbi:MAG: SDR family NAD(P)-dependent oxidoreductase [Alphaproteobacteria bacterium]|jgi:NAD(P)-dependent dehydrogenase (short-subunit alcohol dehydrogenase family)|nr:SDR family NAD(P)-dependent oxidoreductase [Alphaproteobacteria bacterium]MDP6815374.1 SDR family NAD(P)-dependent oxidoreductase [Alphaproteobacteria bacterium]